MLSVIMLNVVSPKYLVFIYFLYVFPMLTPCLCTAKTFKDKSSRKSLSLSLSQCQKETERDSLMAMFDLGADVSKKLV